MRKDFFYYYSKNDCIAIAVLAVLIIAAIIFFSFFGGDKISANDVEKDSIALSAEETSADSTPYYNKEKRKVETFPFDPNTADSTQLLRLGLAPFQVRNIYRYRAAGGVYSRKEDFARLYGLTKGDYDRLAPYIRIADRFRPASDFVTSGNDDRVQGSKFKVQGSKSADETAENRAYTPKISKGEYVSVNTADTTELKRIPGIGPYYARQIVRYGKQLGGYVSKSQLLEIEGFPEEALEYITIEGTPTRINLNKLTLSQLRKHPYINFYQAKEIVDLHRKNGSLKSLADLRFSRQFTANDLKRLEPYVEF